MVTEIETVYTSLLKGMETKDYRLSISFLSIDFHLPVHATADQNLTIPLHLMTITHDVVMVFQSQQNYRVSRESLTRDTLSY